MIVPIVDPAFVGKDRRILVFSRPDRSTWPGIRILAQVNPAEWQAGHTVGVMETGHRIGVAIPAGIQIPLPALRDPESNSGQGYS